MLNSIRKFSKTFLIYIVFLTPFSEIFSQWSVSGSFNGGFINSIMTNDGEIYVGTSTQGVFRSDNNGSNWTQVNSGFGNSLFVQSLSEKVNYIFAGTSSGGFFYSDNKGANWVQSNQGLTMHNVKALITDSSNVYAGLYFAGVYRSTNNGLNWTRFGLGEGDLLYTLCYNKTTFFIGVNGGIYRSSNNGVNWMISINGLTNLDVRSIVQAGNKTYCGTFGGGVFVSENNGSSWSSVSLGLLDQRIITLAPAGNNLFAGTFSKGIHYFNISSKSWIPINKGLTDTTIVSIAIDDKYIFAGSSGEKIWKRPVSEIITSLNQSNSQVSEDFVLYQNYPNPFNPNTVISYQLAVSSFTTLKVYDVLGNEISLIVNEKQSAGNHSIEFDGSNLPSGIYYYNLTAGDFSYTKKMILQK